jgi:uridine monophosphate synthetase
MNTFFSKLTHAITTKNTLLCLGLDPDPTRYPEHFPNFGHDPEQALITWAEGLLDVLPEVCCVKPNIAFYEQFGTNGLRALEQTLAMLPEDIPVLLDAKRGDIGNTANAYAKAAFEVLGVDAITVSPYLGKDALEPFWDYAGKAVFVLCHTSNPSAASVQHHGAPPLFEEIAQLAKTWGNPEKLGLVVGATQPEALARVRELLPEHWLLTPGVGAQGGEMAALAAGLFQDGSGGGAIVPVSRGILYADDPAQAARAFNTALNRVRNNVHTTRASEHDRLIKQLFEVGAVQFGEFTLASGKTSPIYLDVRRLMASPELLREAAKAYARLLAPLEYDLVAGVPYGALTIGTAVSLEVGKPLIYPRKEVKNYGTKRQIEGQFSAGQKVAVIEDLITSGGSVLKAAQQLQQEGLQVRDLLVLIDREQGGKAALEQAGYHLHAVLTMRDLLTSLHAQGLIDQPQVDAVKAYLAAS